MRSMPRANSRLENGLSSYLIPALLKSSICLSHIARQISAWKKRKCPEMVSSQAGGQLMVARPLSLRKTSQFLVGPCLKPMLKKSIRFRKWRCAMARPLLAYKIQAVRAFKRALRRLQAIQVSSKIIFWPVVSFHKSLSLWDRVRAGRFIRQL